MKAISSICLIGAAFVFTGCASHSSKAGGPGATAHDRDKPLVGQADNTFMLDPPNWAANLKQGEAKVVTISIKRGKNFDQDVRLEFENVPAGLTIEPRTPTIKKSENETKVTLKAADDAAINTHMVKLVGKVENGPPATNDLKVDIEKK